MGVGCVSTASSAHTDLSRMLRRAKRRGLFGPLARIHAGLPETTCQNCARCCFESPGVFYVEHLRLVDHISRQPRDVRQALIRRALTELFFSWVDVDRQCIFLERGRCTVYDQRPLACRLFGLVAPRDREQAETEARLAARQDAGRLALLGIKVPEAIISRSLASCDRVRDLAGKPVTVNADALAAQVARLDEALLPRQVVVEEFCFWSLPERLGTACWGSETVEPLHLQLLRRAQQGERIADLVDQVRRSVRLPRPLNP